MCGGGGEDVVGLVEHPGGKGAREDDLGMLDCGAGEDKGLAVFRVLSWNLSAGVLADDARWSV